MNILLQTFLPHRELELALALLAGLDVLLQGPLEFVLF